MYYNKALEDLIVIDPVNKEVLNKINEAKESYNSQLTEQSEEEEEEEDDL